MKIRTFLFAAAAVVAVSACGGVSDTTRIAGVLEEEGLTEVNVMVEQLRIDTLVAVTGGRFAVEIPADVTTMGIIAAGPYRATFIPDGTKLKVVLGPESSVKSSPNSVNARFVEFSEKSISVQENFMTEVQKLQAKTDVTEEQRDSLLVANYDRFTGEFIDFAREALAANSDNIIAISALSSLAVLLQDDAQMDSLIHTLSPAIAANKDVVVMKEGIRARLETAEGKMFKDFTVEDSDGKTVSLSDYVGKGKYVLVDFWASWCGPCKAEIPNVKAAYDKYRKKGLDVLSVAVWDSPEATKDTAKVYGVTWKQIINAGQEPTELYGIEGIPHVILFGPDGTILKRNLRGEEIDQEISKYIR